MIELSSYAVCPNCNNHPRLENYRATRFTWIDIEKPEYKYRILKICLTCFHVFLESFNLEVSEITK